MNHVQRGLLAFAAAAMLPAMAFAGDFFSVTANGSGGTTINVTGSRVLDLTDNLVNQQQEFAGLVGQNVTAAMSFGGVPNAVHFTENAAQTQATLSFPTTGFSQTFNGTSGSDLQQQIRNFLKGNGSRAYGDFIASMDQLSPNAPVDGNPLSSNAIIARDAFNDFGLDSAVTVSGSGGDFKISGQGGVSRAAALDGNYVDANLFSQSQLFNPVSLAMGASLQYTTIGGAANYTLSGIIGLPITLAQPNSAVGWQITPWGFGGVSASYDMAAGVILVGGGGTSSFVVRSGNTEVVVADQIGYTTNVGVTIDNYNFNVPVHQWLAKNGVRTQYNVPGLPILVDVGISYSQFLNSAAIKNFWSPEAGVDINLSGGAHLRVAYNGDFANGYSVSGGSVTLIWAH